jgi:XRE family transcriptional regulator, master regulator for biofilm formation
MNNIGTRIKKLRTQKNISLSELADAAGVAKSYLSNVEREIQSNPSIQVIEKIASSLHVPIHTLLFGEQEVKDLDQGWIDLVRDAMASGVDKEEFKEFLEYQKWKKSQL